MLQAAVGMLQGGAGVQFDSWRSGIAAVFTLCFSREEIKQRGY